MICEQPHRRELLLKVTIVLATAMRRRKIPPSPPKSTNPEFSSPCSFLLHYFRLSLRFADLLSKSPPCRPSSRHLSTLSTLPLAKVLVLLHLLRNPIHGQIVPVHDCTCSPGESWCGQDFCEHIGFVVLTRPPRNSQLSKLYLLADVVVSLLDVFCILVETRVLASWL